MILVDVSLLTVVVEGAGAPQRHDRMAGWAMCASVAETSARVATVARAMLSIMVRSTMVVGLLGVNDITASTRYAPQYKANSHEQFASRRSQCHSAWTRRS